MLKKILHNDYFNILIKKFFLMLFGFIFSIYLARYLGPELKGSFEFILSIVAIATLILDFGIYLSYPYYRRNTDNKEKNLNKFLNIFIFQLVFLSLISIIIFIISSSLNYLLIGLIISFSVFVGQVGYITLIEHLKYRTYTYILLTFIKALLMWTTYYFFAQSLTIPLLITLLIEILFSILYLFKFRSILFYENIFNRSTLQIIKFSFLPLIAAILVNLNYKLDIFLLKIYSTDTIIGLYSLGVAFVSYTMIFPDIFKEVLYSKSAKTDSVKSVVLSLKLSFIFLIIMTVFFLIWGKDAIVILYGKEYIQSYDILFILLISMLGLSIFKIITPYLISLGKNKVRVFILLISVSMNLILNLILIPNYNMVGASIATMISYNITGFLLLLYFMRKTDLKLLETVMFTKKDYDTLITLFKELKK